MIVIDSKVPWIVELAWLVAILAELGHERSIIAREYLHSIIFAIGDEQETSMRVERQAHNVAELAISMAWLLGADRELDSSISIESIVSHLFHFNLSLNDKGMFQSPSTSQKMKMQAHAHTRCERARNEATTNRRRKQRTEPQECQSRTQRVNRTME